MKALLPVISLRGGARGFRSFLDSDDVWHPDCLQSSGKFREYPAAAAYFTGHVDFYDDAVRYGLASKTFQLSTSKRLNSCAVTIKRQASLI
jgi:hypothetical protein